MKKVVLLVLLFLLVRPGYSQKLLMSWSQQNIENYTKEMYDAAQKLSSAELLNKNLNDKAWSEVFLTMNASVNNFMKDTAYHKGLADQLTNATLTKLTGTSRLIIWDRIISGDIIFEGKGLVFENDLFTVAGRANQLLQTLTNKNFGYVTVASTPEQLEAIKKKWERYLANQPVLEATNETYNNAKIPEISSLTAFHALVVSLQPSSGKDQVTKDCLKKVYQLDEMPKDKSSSAIYCNPDTYTFSYLAMLIGEKTHDDKKDAKWWQEYWEANHAKLRWDDVAGNYKVQH